MRLGAGGKWALGLVLFCLVLAVALGWLVTSELAFRWLVQQATERSGGRLRVDQPVRTGLAAFRAARIVYADGDLRVDVRDVDVIVSAASLLRLAPSVENLAVGELRVKLAEGSAEPPSLPASLGLPIPVTIEQARLQRLVLERPEGDLELRDIVFAVRYQAGRYRVELARLQTPWAGVAGDVTLQDSAPFNIDGRIQVDPALETLGRFDIALAGFLDALGVGAVGTAYGARVLAQASIAPLSARRLAAFSAEVEGLESKALNAALPDARLGIGIEATVDSAQAVAGRVHLINTRPGWPAAGRVPIAAASAAFRGSGAQWFADDLLIDAARAGRLTGRARYADDEIVADLAVIRLDLASVHAKMHPTALSGPLHIESAGGKVEVKANIEQPGVRIAFDGLYAAGTVSVHDARWAGAAGEIRLQGSVETGAPHRFRASGHIAGLDPAALGDFPPARVNAAVDATGQIAPLDLRAEIAVIDSRFRGHALAAAARLHLTPERVSDVAAQLSLGSAKASVDGSLGAPDDALAWKLDVPELRLIDERAAGRLQGNGMLRGRWRNPALALAVNGAGLRWGEGLRAGSLVAKAELAEGIAGRFEVSASAEKLVLGELGIDQAQVDISGTRARHDAHILSRSGERRLDSRISGSLGEGPSWTGTLATFTLDGPMPARLERPVELMVSPAAATVGPAVLHIGSGRIDLASLAWQASGRLASRGTIRGIALASLRPLVPVPEPLRALIVGGQWDVDIGESLDGTLVFERESGDIVVPGPSALPAQLRSLRIEARGQGTQIALQAQVDSATFGTVRATGTATAMRRDTAWGIAADSPLDARIDADMPSLAWARPLLGDRATVAGRAEVAMRVHGTVSQPLFDGQLQASQLQATVPELGLSLHDGSMLGRFDGQKLELTSLRFAAGEGEVTGSGSAVLVPGKVAVRVDLKADKLTAISRPDRLIVLSGAVGLEWDAKQMQVVGRVTADRGVIELPPEDTPTPSADVVVLGAKAPPEQATRLDADIAIDLGKAFTVRGRGISTRLAGTVHAQLAKGVPSLTGTVRAVEGTYTAFGQTLSIERGTLTFVGPLGNPALDILAVRKNLTVEVGVAIGGTALLPQVRLVSTPAMSDADKLAWLTLGHGLDQAGRNEAAILQAAAMALLSRGGADSGTKGGLATKFGLDDLSLGTASDTGERIVTVGKRLAANVYLGFERGITGAVNVIKITYDLSRRWSVQARAGTENALDLFYTLGFR